MTPNQYRRGGPRRDHTYVTVDSPVGPMIDRRDPIGALLDSVLGRPPREMFGVAPQRVSPGGDGADGLAAPSRVPAMDRFFVDGAPGRHAPATQPAAHIRATVLPDARSKLLASMSLCAVQSYGEVAAVSLSPRGHARWPGVAPPIAWPIRDSTCHPVIRGTGDWAAIAGLARKRARSIMSGKARTIGHPCRE